MPETIFHLALPADWQDALMLGEYRVSGRDLTLEDEGFIHASTRAQLPATAARVWGPDSPELCLLEIDPALLGDTPLRFDAAGNGDEYPHLYGPLPVEAVVSVDFVRVADGVLRQAVEPGAGEL